MALLAPNKGEVEILSRMVGKHAPGEGDTLRLKLWKTKVGDSMREGDTWIDFTVCTAAGYGDTLLIGDTGTGHWTISTTGDSSNAVYAQKTFTFTAGDSARGYFVTSKTSAGDTVVLWGEKFTDGPYTIPSGGGTIKVTPRISLN
jgi:hypothetical protein